MAELNQETKTLIAKYILWQRSLKPKEGVSTMHVDEVASKVAVFYEQIRTIIDWKEEHLMRRAAIIRKLKRRFLDLELNNFSAQENMGESLILELIRGGQFPNDKIEETKVVPWWAEINFGVVALTYAQQKAYQHATTKVVKDKEGK